MKVESHLIDYIALVGDDFNSYFIARAKCIMKVIEKAMGKTIADKGSEQTVYLFGCSLEDKSFEE